MTPALQMVFATNSSDVSRWGLLGYDAV